MKSVLSTYTKPFSRIIANWSVSTGDLNSLVLSALYNYSAAKLRIIIENTKENNKKIPKSQAIRDYTKITM